MNRIFFTSCLALVSLVLICACEKVECPPQPVTQNNTPIKPVTPSDIRTWTPVSSPSTSFLLDVTFVDANTGFIVGNNGTILKSMDAGTTWSALNSGVTSNLRNIYMFNASKGFVVGNSGVVLQTNDGGTTWQQPTTIIPNTVTLTKVVFIDNNTGFIGGGGGELFKTSDGGSTWASINSGTSCSVYDISFLNTQVGYLSGQCSYIAKTIDGGNTWVSQVSGIADNSTSALLLKIKFADANNGFTIGENTSGLYTVNDDYILSTKNGGNTWVRGTYSYSNITLSGLGVVDGTHAYAVGGDVAANTYTIIKTTDGQNWSTATTGSNRLAGIFMLSGSSAIAVGNNGFILKGSY